MVWHAPAPFVIIVAAVAIAIWKALEWRYKSSIELLKQRVDSRDDEIVRLKSVANSTPRPQDASAADSSQAKALRIIAATVEKGRTVGRHGSDWAAYEAAWPEMNATLLTAEKAFDIRRPESPATGGQSTAFLEGLALLHSVLPLLQMGHLAEARQRAEMMFDEKVERQAAHLRAVQQELDEQQRSAEGAP
jgi:soluble cytochrome b562